MQNEKNKEFILPKNIRQIGVFGDTYKIYVEDFVYTYVHQFLHKKKKEDLVLAAVLLGKTVQQAGQEYVFISGAQKVEFQLSEGSCGEEKTDNEKNEDSTERILTETEKDIVFSRQQEFWDKVYQRIKQFFENCEILGWYFNLDGSNLEVNPQLQQFFESTYKKGSRFLYYEDSLEKEDAFFVQEQHRLQRISGYAVYYEKNPQMQEFMIAEKEQMTPKPLRDSYMREERDEVVQSYRAIMNKLNEKSQKKKIQPVIYVAGVAVLAVVAATGVTQIGNYQNLRILQQTMQTLSGAVDDSADTTVEEKETQSRSEEESAEIETEETETADAAEQAEETDMAETDTSTTEAADTTSQSDVQETADPADNTDEPDTDTAETDPVEQTAATPSDYYIVQKGDSLVSISNKLYNTSSRVEELCRLNNIENMDMIYEGQRLLLP